MESDQDIYTILDVELEKRHGTQHYKQEVDRNDPLNMPHWEIWHFCDGTYPLFTEYYKRNPGSDGVELSKKGGICDSEEESDNDD
jgi:hypothetical protein